MYESILSLIIFHKNQSSLLFVWPELGRDYKHLISKTTAYDIVDPTKRVMAVNELMITNCEV